MARTSRGNANINSLLKSAMAARDAQLAYTDQAAAYDWDLSAKTDADLKTYMNYLQKRQAETQDQSKALTIQSKMVSARRTYTSAEVSRQTISVLYGDESNRDKYAKINALMQQAADSGDASLFQSLDQTRARLSETIQNQDAAGAARAAAGARKAAAASYNQTMNQHAQAAKILEQAFQSGKALTGADGNPIKVQYDKNGVVKRDAQGNIVHDPNGQPLIINSQNYALLKGSVDRAKAATLQQAIDSGNDESGAKQLQLETLQTNPDWNKYASDEAFQRNGGSTNPFVTKIDPNTGQRTLANVQMKDTPQIDPKTGKLVTVRTPAEGVVAGGNDGKQYVITSTTGSSPSSITDRTSSKIKSTDLKQNKVSVGSVGARPDSLQVGGYGPQQFVTNYQTGNLASGAERAQNIYLSPNGDGTHSIAPLKANGTYTDAEGKKQTNYTTTTAKDFPVAPISWDTHQIASNFVNDLHSFAANESNPATIVEHAAGVVGHGVGSAIGGPIGGFLGGVGAVSALGDWGAKLRAESARKAAAAAAARAAQEAAQNAALQRAQAAANANAKANAAHPSVLYQPATPLARYQTASGGSQAPKKVAAGIASYVGYDSTLKKLGW